MNDKNKLTLNRSFILIIIIISSLIIPIISAEKDFNIPIYIQTLAGIEKADSKTIEGILFNYNFEVQKKQEYVPDDKCSVRAEEGSLNIDEMTLGKVDLSFYIPSKNGGLGEGSLTAQKDRDNFFNLGFETTEILETNSKILKFRAIGNGALNQNELSFDDIIVTFDKTSNKVDITGKGNIDFDAKNIEVSFMKWCDGKETEFYLIIIKDRLDEPRTVEEAEELLKQYPEFIDVYEGLKNLSYRDVQVIPEFSTLVGISTLASAIGIFFFVRKR